MPDTPAPTTSPGRPRPRLAYLDNLKVVLVAGVIVGHALITYGDIGSWIYREPSSSAAFNAVAVVLVSSGALFAMGLFFLIAGVLTPRALARKGTGGFLRDRALRLGAPFAAYLLVMPMLAWAADGGQSLDAYLTAQLTLLDPGPLWFVGVLLLFSAGYATWRAVSPPSAAASPMPRWTLPAVALAIAAGSMVVRLWFAMDSFQVFAAHVWQWPQCLALFVLGILAGERGWLSPVGPRQRRLGAAAAAGALAVLLVAIAGADGPDAFAGGMRWQAALAATCEGAMAVGLSVWLLGLFQQRFDRTGPLRRALARAAFGAYVLQAPVLVGIALLARPLPSPPEVKLLVVAPAAVAVSFALAWLLTRVPGLRRIL